MRTSTTLASLLCASFVAVTGHVGVAHAAPPGSGIEPLQVLEIATDDADDQAKALTTALKARIRASKTHSVGEQSISLAVVSLSLKCGDVPDAKCQDKIGDKIKASAYIWGTMKKAPNHQVVADMHIWHKGQPDVRQQFQIADTLIDPLDATLQKEADQIFVLLTQYGKVGVARISVDKGSGELFIDGQSSGPVSAAAPAELTIPNGEHNFELRSAGKVIAAGKGTVNATTPVDVKLTAAAIPAGGATGPTTGPSQNNNNNPAPSGDQSWKKTAGYVGIGAGVVLVGVGVFAGVKNSSTSNDSGWKAYKGVASNESVSHFSDACTAAKAGYVVHTPGALSAADANSKCSSAKTLQALQFIAYPLGVIAAGAGVYFLVTAPKDGAQKTVGDRLTITPVTSPTYNGLDAQLVF